MTSESIKSSAGRGNPEPHAAQIGEKLGKNSGFPIIEPEDFADAIELQTRIIANADIARVGPLQMLGRLNNAMSALDQAETVARRNLIASAYEVANTLRQDTEALLKFRDDQFWEGYPRPKANGDNVLRFALIAIRGNSKAQRAWASEWAKRLEPAFEKRIPAEQIPAFLEASAQINTSKRKTRAALKVVEMAQTVVRIGGEAGHRSFEETLEIGERRNFEVIADQRTRIFISVTAPVRPHRRRRRWVDDGYNLDAEKVIQRVPGRAPPG